ncbi:MAG: hypothetical protein RB191_02135 [Terriglobia bacterium]|nr:hypothetical protein [Terriglobia bacterium]
MISYRSPAALQAANRQADKIMAAHTGKVAKTAAPKPAKTARETPLQFRKRAGDLTAVK